MQGGHGCDATSVHGCKPNLFTAYCTGGQRTGVMDRYRRREKQEMGG